MARSFNDMDSTILSALTASEAIQMFRALLWCSARRHALPIQSITITTNVNVADGGIDAEIAPNTVTPDQDMLFSGNSFFQIKAGALAAPWQKGWLHRELFGNSKVPVKATLGSAVRHCLDRKGRYIIVCFGCDPTSSQRAKAVAYLRKLIQACGYKHPRVDVWGQGTLAGLVHPFPSIALRLSDHHHLPFLSYEDWKLDAEMCRPLHLGKAQEQVIEQFRSCLRGSDVGHIRFIGEPGLGKTRLALEVVSADDLAPTVIYVRHPEDFQQSPLFNAILRADDLSSMTLIIDDCPERERASIWNVLRQRSDRIRLVTMDHGPETSADDLMRVIECPMLEKEQIKAILAEYIGASHDTDRWSEFCSGSPRVAHAVGENLRRNPDDILKSPAAVPIWERFVHGNSTGGSQDESQKETVLRHIALFHKFGFEHPVDDEAKFIASLVERVDPAITWPRFQSVVKQFRDRRLLQGKTTLFVVPRLLHIYFWCQFWEHYGTGTDIADLMSRMPPSLFRWFTEMFKYGHASPSCMARIEQITSSGGPFDNREFIVSGPGATFLDELAEAHPEATLGCIERTIGRWSHDEMTGFDRHRQHIVWALEKIAIWKDLFRRAAGVLLKLAVAENASNTNNATGVFCSLFAMGYRRFASSEAPPELRLPVLRAALESTDPAERLIGLKAVAENLADHPYSKAVGPEYQGLRQVPALWNPAKWGEVFDGYRAAWQLLAEFRRATGSEKTEATKVMIDAAFFLVQNRWIEDEILAGLEELAADPDTNLCLIVQFISRFQMLKWRSLSRKAANRLRTLDRKLYGTTLASQIRRLVLLGNSDDVDRPGRGEYGKKHMDALRQLARSAMDQPDVLMSLLPSLSSGNGFALNAFGRALGDADKTREWWPRLLDGLLRAGNQRNPGFAAGYLLVVFVGDRSRWESISLQLLQDNVLKQYAKQLVAGSGMTDTVLNELCTAVERGEIPPDALDGLGYTSRSCGISIQRCIGFLKWCVQRGTSELVRIALDTAHLLFCFDKDAPAVPEQPLLDLLMDPQVFNAETRGGGHYEWAELTKRYVDTYPHHAIRLLQSVLEHFDDFHFVVGLSNSAAQAAVLDLIRRDREASWTVIAAKLSPLEGRIAAHLIRWLGPAYTFGEGVGSAPLSLFDTSAVFAWVDGDPKKRAPFIARGCPKTLVPGEGGTLTRELLVRYGDQDEVRRALYANFGSGGWCGNASDYHGKMRDMMRGWLSSETAKPVIDWLEQYIEYLGRRIKAEKIEEERRF